MIDIKTIITINYNPLNKILRSLDEISRPPYNSLNRIPRCLEEKFRPSHPSVKISFFAPL